MMRRTRRRIEALEAVAHKPQPVITPAELDLRLSYVAEQVATDLDGIRADVADQRRKLGLLLEAAEAGADALGYRGFGPDGRRSGIEVGADFARAARALGDSAPGREPCCAGDLPGVITGIIRRHQGPDFTAEACAAEIAEWVTR